MHIAALYESVTKSIIDDLENGVAPWTKPWKNGNTGGIMPMNAATKRSYNGINIPILWHAQLSRGYPTASWMTYKQANEIGGQVRGERNPPTLSSPRSSPSKTGRARRRSRSAC